MNKQPEVKINVNVSFDIGDININVNEPADDFRCELGELAEPIKGVECETECDCPLSQCGEDWGDQIILHELGKLVKNGMVSTPMRNNILQRMGRMVRPEVAFSEWEDDPTFRKYVEHIENQIREGLRKFADEDELRGSIFPFVDKPTGSKYVTAEDTGKGEFVGVVADDGEDMGKRVHIMTTPLSPSSGLTKSAISHVDEPEPTFVWPDWLQSNYIAMNQDGKWNGFDDEPRALYHVWHSPTEIIGLGVPLDGAGGFDPPEVGDWDESLIARPVNNADPSLVVATGEDTSDGTVVTDPPDFSDAWCEYSDVNYIAVDYDGRSFGFNARPKKGDGLWLCDESVNRSLHDLGDGFYVKEGPVLNWEELLFERPAEATEEPEAPKESIVEWPEGVHGRYIAMDANQSWWAYSVKPRTSGRSWVVPDGDGLLFRVSRLAVNTPGGIDWKESLIENPNYTEATECPTPSE